MTFLVVSAFPENNRGSFPISIPRVDALLTARLRTKLDHSNIQHQKSSTSNFLDCSKRRDGRMSLVQSRTEMSSFSRCVFLAICLFHQGLTATTTFSAFTKPSLPRIHPQARPTLRRPTLHLFVLAQVQLVLYML